MLKSLNEIVSFAYKSPHSSWYRRVCAEHGVNECPDIRSLDDFQRLPLIDRTVLNRFAPEERLSTSTTFVDDIRSTSGTSGQTPFFYFRDTRYRPIALRMVEDGARRRLYFWGYHSMVTFVENDRKVGLQTVVCDPNQLASYLPLLSQLRINALGGAPSILLLFGQLLERIEERAQIRFIECSGEPLRPQIMSDLKRLFPVARIYDHYAISEVGQEIGFRTPQCTNQKPGYFHLNDRDLYAEVQGCELVITHLNPPRALPLIRYKTGDSVSWIGEDECQCGYRGVSFELSGRANVDFIRISGVEIRYEEIWAIVTKAQNATKPYLSVEVSERMSDGVQKITLSLKLVRSTTASLSEDDISTLLKQKLSQDLRLSATTRLSDMIQIGIFEEPHIEFLKDVQLASKAPGIRMVEG